MGSFRHLLRVLRKLNGAGFSADEARLLMPYQIEILKSAPDKEAIRRMRKYLKDRQGIATCSKNNTPSSPDPSPGP